MLSEIVQLETAYNALLPLRRLETSPSGELLTAANLWSQAVWEKGCSLGPMPMSEEQITSGLTLAKHPVFICGVHRSGTTLVRDLLDNHPDLVVLPSEGTFYTNLERKILAIPAALQAAFIGKEWLRRFANPINQPPYWLLGRSTENDSYYVNFVRYILSWWTIVTHAERTQWPHTIIILSYAASIGRLSAKSWVDKTPTNERFINRIWNEMPDAKIIHVIREPLAVLASRKKSEPYFNLRNVIVAMKLSFTTATLLPIAKDSRYLLLRYEDLCSDTVLQINRLASLMDINPSPELYTPTVNGLPSLANSSFTNIEKPGEIITPTLRRQNDLRTSETRLLSAYIGTLASKLGYPLKKISLLNSYYQKLKHIARFKFNRIFHSH